MRYRLRTLMIVAGAVPPAIGFLWFHWGFVLLLLVCLALLAFWFLFSLGLARFLAHSLVSFIMD
jgi:hypothetical protein